MKQIIIIIFVLTGTQLFGTAQFPDLLIYKGDTFLLHSNPLEVYFDKKGERTIGGIEIKGSCTALWRGYVATWKLENDSLFLIRIQTDYCDDIPNEVDITKEFNSNKIFADWVSFEIISPYGKQIKYIHQGYQSIYEFERGFDFVNGKLVNINHYDNSKSRQPSITREPEILYKFLYDNVNWELIESQNLTNEKRVIARFKTDENAKPIDIEIEFGINPKIDTEAKRVIGLIPDWDVHFKRGKVIEIKWRLPIIFDKEFYEQKLKKKTETDN